MTIPNGTPGEHYQFLTTTAHIPPTTLGVPIVKHNGSILFHLLPQSNAPMPYELPSSANFTARPWLEYGLAAGGSSISSYNVDSLGGEGLDLDRASSDTFVESHKEFVFDRTDVRVVFVTLYSLVFCCCFFGESKVGGAHLSFELSTDCYRIRPYSSLSCTISYVSFTTLILGTWRHF